MKQKPALLSLYILTSIVIVTSLCGLYPKQIPKKRVAIIFGMSSYQAVDHLPLCKNDADSFANILKKLDFEVLSFKDLSRENMENELTKWGRILKNYEAGLFYFSGHGAEVQGENYLFPVDARLSTPSQTKYSTVPVGEILDMFAQAKTEPNSKLKTNILILDACRDNPYTKSWSKSVGTQEGLANIGLVPNGTFIGFATSPGKTASAIGSKNSPYTQAILTNILSPNESIDDIFTNVNATTRFLTGGDQTPFKNSSLDSKFYFLTDQTLTKGASTSTKEINYLNFTANKIKDFTEVLPLGIPLNDVIVDEYGPTFSNSVKYEDLPVAPECKNKLIKYYWLKLSQSKHYNSIVNYTSAYGLSNEIRNDSYIVYMFSGNKLVLISIRLYFNQIEFHKKMAESFNIDLAKYPSKFIYTNENITAFFALEQNINVTTIAIGERDADKYCSFYWYGEPK